MMRRAIVMIPAVLALTACADGTSPSTETEVSLAELSINERESGPALTMAGVSGVTVPLALSGTVSGDPFAIAVGRTPGTLPPPPVCTPNLGVTNCVATVGPFTYRYSFGARDSLGLRFDSEMTGTLPANGAVPARRVRRQSTSWSSAGTPPVGAITPWVTRHVSQEIGSSEPEGGVGVVTADTGSTNVRVFFPRFDSLPSMSPAARIPRMIGTSRRVFWQALRSASGTVAPAFRRETTIWDSSTVVQTLIETASGTRRCRIDLAAARPVARCE